MKKGSCVVSLVVSTLFFSSLLLGQTPVINAKGKTGQTTTGDSKAQDANQAKGDLKSDVGAAVDPNTFVLGAEDVIAIRVWREPDVSGEFAIRPDGKITMALIGELTAGGLTPKQLTAQISQKLTKFINSPEVFIVVREVRSKKFLVSGEVNRPGSYPLVSPTTVVEALVNAGGFREFANKKKIIIIRGSERIKFNYADVIKGKGEGLTLKVEAGDHIVVP
jgi:polysaccharide export outer membrane protein